MKEALLLRDESERDDRFKAGLEPDHVTSKLDKESVLSIMSEQSDALLSIVHANFKTLSIEFE